MSSTPYQTTDTLGTPGVYTKDFSFLLASISAADMVTAYTPGHPFRILGINATVTAPATTAAKAATVTAYIGSTAVTGASLALTSANMTPLGKVNSAAATVSNSTLTGSSTDTISLTASSVTAFAEGSATFSVVIQNLSAT